jgi:hypothetical protein
MDKPLLVFVALHFEVGLSSPFLNSDNFETGFKLQPLKYHQGNKEMMNDSD